MRREEAKNKAETSEKSQKIRRISIWGGALALLVGAIFLLIKMGGNPLPASTPGTLSSPVTESDRSAGAKDAKVALVEYADFQCPACAAYYPILKQLKTEFGDKILVAYRYFPLYQIHKNANVSAHAAEAAGRQGKFWEMHNLLFDNQNSWAETNNAKETFIKYADSLKLNMEQFKKDIDDGEVDARVTKDYQSGTASGVNSTPTFFLNGAKIQNPKNYDEFKSTINNALGEPAQNS